MFYIQPRAISNKPSRIGNKISKNISRAPYESFEELDLLFVDSF
jgi:hypothetical protein